MVYCTCCCIYTLWWNIGPFDKPPCTTWSKEFKRVEIPSWHLFYYNIYGRRTVTNIWRHLFRLIMLMCDFNHHPSPLSTFKVKVFCKFNFPTLNRPKIITLGPPTPPNSPGGTRFYVIVVIIRVTDNEFFFKKAVCVSQAQKWLANWFRNWYNLNQSITQYSWNFNLMFLQKSRWKLLSIYM